jgi:hypothetical protein
MVDALRWRNTAFELPPDDRPVEALRPNHSLTFAVWDGKHWGYALSESFTGHDISLDRRPLCKFGRRFVAFWRPWPGWPDGWGANPEEESTEEEPSDVLYRSLEA